MWTGLGMRELYRLEPGARWALIAQVRAGTAATTAAAARMFATKARLHALTGGQGPRR